MIVKLPMPAPRRGLRAAVVATAACIAFAAAGTAALAEDSRPVAGDTTSQTSPYSLQLRALTSPSGAELRIQVVPENGAADAATPTWSQTMSFKWLQIRIFGANDRLQSVRTYQNVAIRSGKTTFDLGRLARNRRIDVAALVKEKQSASLYSVRGTTITQLRPDLVIGTLQVPVQTLTTRPVDVQFQVAEVNGDTGATAKVTLLWGPSALATQEVSVPADGRVSVTFAGVQLPTAAPVELAVVVSDVSPDEANPTNNTRRATIDVTEHELVPSWQVLPSFGGYGAQFNQHVYAAVTPKPAGSLPALEDKVKALEPQLVRVFFNEVQEATPDQMASFIETVELAQQAGATVNITYQTAANAKTKPDEYMGKFAATLDDLVRTRGFTNVRWVTIQNEPNSTLVTLPQYNALYRALHAQLVMRGLRDQIGLMGGDLVESSSVAGSNHRFWFQYMAQNMNDILDAYSVHIYWNYWDIPRMEFRLKSVREIVNEELPAEARKPVYVTEFGVRGIQNVAGLPVIQPGYWSGATPPSSSDSTPLSRTNIAAFQHLLFNVVATQLGFSGTVKWDAFWGRYTAGYKEVYNLIGPADEGWPLFPSYHALLLQLQTTQRGWQVLGVAPWADDDWKLSDAGQANDQPEKELTAYAGPDGQLTLIGLDSHGVQLNAVSTETPSYSIGGLPPGQALTLAVWNASGNGENSIAETVTANAVGVARFTVPLQAAFALTTVPVG